MIDWNWNTRRTADGDWCWYRTQKFASGMTGEFSWWDFDDRKASVSFIIYRKRKDRDKLESREMTGRDGLEPAMWALKCLSDVEGRSGIDSVFVDWTDNRRKEIYTRVLGRRGYHVADSGGLVKHLSK